MCLRYTLHKPDEAVAAMERALGCRLALPEGVKPRYNVTLTSVMPVVALRDDQPGVRGMMWGLVPAHEQSRAERKLLPNAKSETITALRSFKEGAAHRRCLVPANGFYEWRKAGNERLPHLFMLRSEEPFAFAGIWEPPAGDLPETFCILTTAPNATVSPIHDRMPVILTKETIPRWIGAAPLPEAELHALTQPLAAERMIVRPVDRFVNSTRNEGPQCLAPPGEFQDEMTLA